MNYFLFFILGTIIGSFLNVCIYRLPQNESIISPRSHCPNCKNLINAYDNIPLLSFVVLKGQCRHCHKNISVRYLAIELLTGLLFVFMLHQFGFSERLFSSLILVSTLIVISVIDFETLIIYDRFHLIILGLALFKIFLQPSLLKTSIIGAMSLSLPLFLLSFITGNLGMADVKLMFVAGAYCGLQQISIAFFISTLTGSIYALYLICFKQKHRQTIIPFGPFLSFGIFIVSMIM